MALPVKRGAAMCLSGARPACLLRNTEAPQYLYRTGRRHSRPDRVTVTQPTTLALSESAQTPYLTYWSVVFARMTPRTAVPAMPDRGPLIEPTPGNMI